MDQELLEEFKEQIIFRLDESTRMIALSFEKLSEDDIWKSVNDSSNSIANLILHLCGNIRQYGIASLGKKEDKRDRNKEFDTVTGFTRNELLEKLKNTVEEAKIVIQSCSYLEMMRKREVQGFYFSGIGIAVHITEHYSYHTGQIAFMTKHLKNEDLRFYEGMDLNTKNKD